MKNKKKKNNDIFDIVTFSQNNGPLEFNKRILEVAESYSDQIICSSTKYRYFYKDYKTFSTKLNKPICNYYIKNFILNNYYELTLSANIFIINENGEENNFLFNIEDFEDGSWLFQLDRKKYRIFIPKKEFYIHIKNITKNLIKHCKKNHRTQKARLPGWKKINKMTLKKYVTPSFYDFNNSINEIDSKKTDIENSIHYIFNLLNLTDYTISIPLISYTLLSVLRTVIKNKLDFMISLSNADNEEGLLIASIYCNLYDFEDRTVHKIHSFNDDIRVIGLKASRTKDSVLILGDYSSTDKIIAINDFFISDTYCPSDYDNKKGECLDESGDTYFTHGLGLLLLNRKKTFLENTLNIDLLGLDNKKISAFKVDETQLRQAIYVFIHRYLKYIVGIKNGSLEIKVDDLFEFPYNDIDIKGKEIISYLLYSFGLFLDFAEEQNIIDDSRHIELYQTAKKIILDLVCKSFHSEEYEKEQLIQRGKMLCEKINSYFEKQINSKEIRRTGSFSIENLDDVMLWYDDQSILIKQKKLKLICAYQGFSTEIPTNIKHILAEKGIIETQNAGKGSRLEFSVHYKKKLYSNYQSKDRFISFNRKVCRELSIFENVEKQIQRLTIKTAMDKAHNFVINNTTPVNMVIIDEEE